MRLSSAPKQMARLSLTPLIDVVFLLLIFFILASTFMRFTSVPISSAASSSASAPGQNEIALIRLQPNEDGIFVNGRVVTLAELEATVSELTVKGISHAVVQPVGEANVQTLVSVLELLKKTSLEKVVVSK